MPPRKNKTKFVPLDGSNPPRPAPKKKESPSPLSSVPSTQQSAKTTTPSTSASLSEPTVPEVCFICTEPIQYHSVGECNHRTCHVCSLRMRALYKNKSCSMCKTELSSVVFTPSPTSPFESFNLAQLENVDQRLSIHFENKEVYDDTMILLRFNCPDSSCDVYCPEGWAELKRHVKSVHGKVLCNICIQHKKVFIHEHTLFVESELGQHYREGEADDPSFKGHPECGFCMISFYGNDELYEHCREKHEQCFLCLRNGVRHQYHLNYSEMELHFREDHFPCMERECLEKKFVVFSSDIDLKAHQGEVHKIGASKRGIPLEINFQYRSASDSGDRGSNSNSGGWSRKGKGKRGGVGGGDNYQNISIIPADSIQSPVTTISNSRGGPSVSSSSSSSSSTSTSSPLSQPPPTQNRSKSSGAAKRQLRPPPGFGAQLSSGGGGDQPDAESTAVQKNGAVQTSASNDPDLQKNLQTLFNNNSTTFSEFKSLASSFKNSLLSAKEFIGYLAKLVSDGNPSSQAAEKQKASSAWDNSSEDMFYFDSDTLSLIGKVWQKLAESVPIPECGGSSQSLLTKEQRSAEMLRAWNDFKVKVRTSAATNIGQSLSSKPYGLLTTATASSSSTPTAARVLVIKSSASRHKFNNSNFRSGITNSSRINSVNWDRVADKIISREERESGRQEEEVEQQQRPSFARVGKDGFRPSLTSSDYPSLNNSSYTSSLLPIGSSSRASPPPFVHGKPNGNDFPSLRTPSSSSATALASSSTASSSVQSDFVKMGLWEVEAGASCSKDEGDSPKRGKGKQKKTKQVLFTVGMVPR